MFHIGKRGHVGTGKRTRIRSINVHSCPIRGFVPQSGSYCKGAPTGYGEPSEVCRTVPLESGTGVKKYGQDVGSDRTVEARDEVPPSTSLSCETSATGRGRWGRPHKDFAFPESFK